MESGFSMTEPDSAGSDPRSLKTTAVKDGDEWVINGHKIMTSNGNRADFLVVMCRTEEDGDEGGANSKMTQIIVPTDSPIQSPAEIKGKTLAFTSPTSNSGFKAPSAILKGEFDLIADRDFTPTFSGKHDNSILGVYNGDYEIASIANSVLERMIRRGVIEEGKIRSVYKSPTFPTTGYGHAHNLHPELVAKLKNAFWTFDFDVDATFKKEFAKADRFIGIRHINDWAVIRQIDTANGVSYDCK